jgi:hypothetical protein
MAVHLDIGALKFPPSRQDGFGWHDIPGTLCRANFRVVPAGTGKLSVIFQM